MSTSSVAPALELCAITKVFPGLDANDAVVANDAVDLTISVGEVHALLGENGAGKSTLMKIVYGLIQPDGGELRVDGLPVTLRQPQDAMALGIGMVHQHFMLIPTFSIIENIVLGQKASPYPLLKLDEARRAVQPLADDLGLDAPLTAKVATCTVGQQQKIEIIKALYRGARILILDEPTAVLLPQEAAELFRLIAQLRADGVTIIFISHKLNEVLAVSDRVTVMRRGHVVATVDASTVTAQDLAALMVGQAIDLTLAKRAAQPGAVTLSLDNVTVYDAAAGRQLNGLTLALRAGEIHGLAGVDGNGQQTLTQVIMGLTAPTEGEVRFRGRDITGLDTAARLRLGIEHIPENRQTEGLVLDMSLTDNLLLESFARPPFAQHGWRQYPVMRAHAQRLMAQFDIRAPNSEIAAKKLSGGNQQKVLLARALGQNPVVLSAMQPTRGLDVGAAAAVQRQLIAARDRGCAVLLISSELDEIMALSDVISVIYEGQIVETAPSAATNLNRIGFLMAGGAPDAAPPAAAEPGEFPP